MTYNNNYQLLYAKELYLKKTYDSFADLLIFNCTKKFYFALTWDDGPTTRGTYCRNLRHFKT